MSRRHWIAVASAEHVWLRRSQGLLQVCHGKAAPLRRIAPDDGIAYYSPTNSFGGTDRLQAFTALGTVKPGTPYQVDMGDGFRPFRRDVSWREATEAPIHPLLEHLSFSRENKNWGYQLRFGLFEIPSQDLLLIAAAMGVTL
jgi:hypothetical protein